MSGRGGLNKALLTLGMLLSFTLILQTAAAPSGLQAVVNGPSEISLQWQGLAPGEEGYELERSGDGGWTFSPLASLPPETTTHLDSGLSPCSQYCYRVRAAGQEPSPYSRVACATTSSVPSTQAVSILEEDFEGFFFPPPAWPATTWISAQTYGAASGTLYARASSTAPGELRTPSFDCSDALAVEITFWIRASLSGSDVFRASFEGSSQSIVLESYTSTKMNWLQKSYTVSDPSFLSSSCALSWYAQISSISQANVDMVTVKKVFGSPGPAPSHIEVHPEGQTICENGMATFTVVASGEDLAYSWETYEGGSWMRLGASGSTMTISGLGAGADGRLFRCKVSGACGVAYSLPAVLHVERPVSIVSQPSDASACAGEEASFSVVAEGEGLSYSWEFDDGSGGGFVPLEDGPGVSGATSPTLTLSEMGAMRAGRYRCAVESVCGLVLSAEATLSQGESPAISGEPSDLVVNEGGAATFTVMASGGGLAYRWERSDDGGVTFSALDGATAPSYTIPAASIDDDGALLRCVLSTPCGTATSRVALLEVLRVQEIPLEAGWNAISLAVRPSDSSISSVLASIAGQHGLVYAWTEGGWSIYDPVASPPGDLGEMHEGRGYWIEMQAPATLRVTGKALREPLPLSLEPGWNLVGCASWRAWALPEALAEHGLGEGLGLVYAYWGGWSHHDPSAPGWSNTLSQISPGGGYWVWVDSPTTWRLPAE